MAAAVVGVNFSEVAEEFGSGDGTKTALYGREKKKRSYKRVMIHRAVVAAGGERRGVSNSAE